jgi:hypothetical protein
LLRWLLNYGQAANIRDDELAVPAVRNYLGLALALSNLAR